MHMLTLLIFIVVIYVGFMAIKYSFLLFVGVLLLLIMGITNIGQKHEQTVYSSTLYDICINDYTYGVDRNSLGRLETREQHNASCYNLYSPYGSTTNGK